MQVWGVHRWPVTSQIAQGNRQDAGNVSRFTDMVTGNHGLGFRVWGLPSAYGWGDEGPCAFGIQSDARLGWRWKVVVVVFVMAMMFIDE